MKIKEHLQERVCPLCRSSDQSRLLYKSNLDESRLDDFAFASRKLPELMHLDLIACPQCSLLYASPAFTAEFLAEAYQRAAYDSHSEADYAAATYGRLLPSICAVLRQRHSALEIGTGNGAFLSKLKEAGFAEVVGVEPSEAAMATARPEIRALIRPGMFNADDFALSRFDVVACFQTLEHLDDPRSFVASAFRVLKPGGAIYLVAHDYNSWVTRVLGRKSPIFDVEHLQLFSRSSLRFLVEVCGFDRIRIQTIRNRYPVAYWLKLAPLPPDLKRGVGRALATAHLAQLTLPMNIGNLAVIAYKPC